MVAILIGFCGSYLHVFFEHAQRKTHHVDRFDLHALVQRTIVLDLLYMQAMNWGKKKKKEFNLCIEIVFCDKILQKNNVNIYSARVRVS